MSLWNRLADNVGPSRFASSVRGVVVSKHCTLRSFISRMSFAGTLVCSCVLFSALSLWPRVEASFIAAPTYPAGSASARSLVVGDFNGDGIPDLVVANKGTPANNFTDGGVTILLGNGDGSFHPAQTYLLGLVTAVAVGDFNSDGHLDLAVANYGSGGVVSILLGNGDGSFQAAKNYAAGPYPYSVAVGDFNGDGIADLAVVNFVDPEAVSILLGNGDGSFQAPQGSYPAGGAPDSVVVADFNGDGFADLVVVNSGGVSVLLGNGDGSFRPAQKYTVVGSPYFVAVGDFNGDGIPDLATANNFSGTVSVLLGNGDGSFQNAIDYPAGGRLTAVAVGDINGDGHLDLAVAGTSGVSILLGKGDGTFQAAQSYAGGGFPIRVAIADFNHDGHLDIALANSGDDSSTRHGSSVSILLGNGDGGFQAARSYDVGDSPLVVGVGDFNGDGIPDLVTANPFGRVSVLLGKSDGTFQDALILPAGQGPRSVAVGDFNGDGKLDIVTTNFAYSVNFHPPRVDILESDVRVFLGTGDGTFVPAGIFGTGLGPIAAVVGDFNGDGILDLAVADGGYGYAPGSTLSVLLGNGDGSFQPAVNYAVGYSPLSVAVGDFNGDGIQDLAMVGYEGNGGPGTLSVRLGKGDGTFGAAQDYAVGFGASAVAVGDFNGDDILDLVTANWSGTVSVLLGNGNGTFRDAQSYATGSKGVFVAVADFNRDGIPDLAVAGIPSLPGANSDSNTVTVLLGKGEGTFQAAQGYAAGGFASSVVAADFNGDGFPDLAVTDGAVTVLLNAADWGR